MGGHHHYLRRIFACMVSHAACVYDFASVIGDAFGPRARATIQLIWIRSERCRSVFPRLLSSIPTHFSAFQLHGVAFEARTQVMFLAREPGCRSVFPRLLSSIPTHFSAVQLHGVAFEA